MKTIKKILEKLCEQTLLTDNPKVSEYVKKAESQIKVLMDDGEILKLIPYERHYEVKDSKEIPAGWYVEIDDLAQAIKAWRENK